MNSAFSITAEWIDGEHGPEEVRRTSALLTILVDNRVATRVADGWSQTVRRDVRLSAYPLALWLAACWWRLLWEPASEGKCDVSWRTAHEMAAAGHGFVWPRISFEPDGETVAVVCHPTEEVPTEPLRYLESFRRHVPREAFEGAVSDFVSLVLERLGAVGLRDSDLSKLWSELREERMDPDTAELRRLEARLGRDPDEAPVEALERLNNMARQAGREAIGEIAPACASEDLNGAIGKIVALANSAGIEAHLGLATTPLREAWQQKMQTQPPGLRGRLLADEARKLWGLGDRLADRQLADILAFKEEVLQHHPNPNGKLPLGLAVRQSDSQKLNLIFRRRNRPGRRFEAARFLADSLIASSNDRWLPETDSKTARQKTQRAFAIELLCPITALQGQLDGDFSADAIDEAADHFGVSALAVRSHLANNGLLPSDEVSG